MVYSCNSRYLEGVEVGGSQSIVGLEKCIRHYAKIKLKTKGLRAWLKL
jgi:hypothetical protein